MLSVKTEWVMTRTGLYMQLIVADWPGTWTYEPPTYEEMLEASRRYMMKRYGGWSL